jgi:hypothetical protein
MKKLVKLNKLVALTLAFVMAVYAFSPISAAAAKADKGASVPVIGSNATGSFAGILNITKFVVENNQLMAIGTLTGTVRTAGGVVTNITQAVAVPVGGTTTTGTCEILDLQIGAIHLDLLGLVIDLAPVNLVITAQSGPGNLLGNLLCAVAGLLDGGSLTDLAGLLNKILRILG